ncbi:MAG: Gfo/Idh/MocA family oxidoreductase [archaeon]
MKFLVIGCGSIGRRHMKNLLCMGHEVVGADLSAEYRKWIEENLHIQAVENAEAALNVAGNRMQKPDAVLVCTPPSTHVELASIALKAGIHVFVEKPLSNTLEGVEDLIKLAKSKKLCLAVGYNFRFSKRLMKVKELVDSGSIGKVLYARILIGQYLPDWRPWQDYRKSYTSSKKLGGGIILDASHELDYARWLFGEIDSICCMADKLSSLEVETEDVAEILLKTAGSVIINIHLDFVRRDRARTCEIVGEKGTIRWDAISGKLSLVSFDKDGAADEQAFDLADDLNDMYVSELSHFIDCMKNKKKPLVDGTEGKTSLLLALKAKESSEKSKYLRIK